MNGILTMMVSKTAVILSPHIEKGAIKPTKSIEQFYTLLEACSFSVQIHQLDSDDLSYLSLKADIVCIDMCNNHSNEAVDKILRMETRLPSIALLNAPSKGICEKKALMQGIKGVFYVDDRRDIILKGIESITNGESWFKRATLNAVLNDLMSNHSSNAQPQEINPSAMVDSVLTKREWMIVSLVAKGAQNQEIANQLHISVNTVKTHIYSIFRKTKCRNRVELITWSQMARMSA